MKELKLEKLQMFLETHIPKLRETPAGKYAAHILVASVAVLVVGVIGFVTGSLTASSSKSCQGVCCEKELKSAQESIQNAIVSLQTALESIKTCSDQSAVATATESLPAAQLANLKERLEGLKEVAMTAAQAEAKAMVGRKLFVAMTQTNIEREGAGMESVWPKGKNQELSGDNDDIAGHVFPSATAYFRELMDFKNAGKSEWTPYTDIGADSLKDIIDPKTGRAKWIVVQGITDEAADRIPVLVSENVDVESLITAAGEHSIPGSAKLRYAGKYAVVVNKAGTVRIVCEGKDSLREIYGSTTELSTSISYLMP